MRNSKKNISEQCESVIKHFIVDENIQNAFVSINNRLLDFNILEITGMGSQEIKHSNILAWLLGDNEHGLGYSIFENFLKKILLSNQTNNKDNFEILNSLQTYLYLPENEKQISIYREKDNIDLLIIDQANKVVIVIENKIFSQEGDNQLKKYEEKINLKYPEREWKKFFIFLTKDLSEPSSPIWLSANYQMVLDVLNDFLASDSDSKNELSVKSKIIIESYIDLLKRRNIVEDKELKNICEKIWDNKHYKQALEILYEYKPDMQSLISEYLLQKIETFDNVGMTDSIKTYIRFYDKRWDIVPVQKKGKGWSKKIERILMFEFVNRSDKLTLQLLIGPAEKQEYREYFAELLNIKENINKKYKAINNSVYRTIEILEKDDLDTKSIEQIEEKIDQKLDRFFAENGKFNKVYEVIAENFKKSNQNQT